MKVVKKLDGWCAVVALKFLSGLPDAIVLQVCEHEDFDPFHGMDDESILVAAKDLGVNLKKIKIGRYPYTFAEFKKKHLFGKFLLRTVDHVFVLYDGLVVDPLCEKSGLRRIIRAAWKVIP